MSSNLGCEPLSKFADRLYFTTFAGPLPRPQVLNARATESDRPLVREYTPRGQTTTPEHGAPYYYFTLDNDLSYLSFSLDWGPLNMAMVYRACILIHELLEDKELAQYRLVLYSSSDPRKKANAALLMALFIMIVHRLTPWESFQPIAELDFLPFRDAGRGKADFDLSIQDCLWGIWKAVQCGLCDFSEFNVDDYEYYEKVENGDWNWITPNFIAFASPVDQTWIRMEKAKTDPDPDPDSPLTFFFQRKLPQAFVNCLDYFEQRNVKLVVRLNNPLYDKKLFADRSIDHVELYFDDGTNPSDDIVRKFIDMADKIIEGGGVVAVHCKAGLGRTGTLIGAYLIWKYGFTASEAIAFMRIVRPGSVVGPQQQFMYLKQMEWTKWAAVDELKKAQVPSAIASTVIAAPATPPAEDEEMSDIAPINVIISQPLPPVTPSKHVAAAAERANSIFPPGQPRKTPLAKRTISEWEDDDDADEVFPLVPKTPVNRPSKAPKRISNASRRAPPASDQRPTRITRSTKKASSAARPNVQPNKIPRLAHGTTTRNTSSKPKLAPIATAMATAASATAAATTTTTTTTSTSRRIPRSPGTPTMPSRLPTLIGSKRSLHNAMNSLTDLAAVVNASKGTGKSDAWVSKNASAVSVPTSKSERPGLRSTRRRRSSFSAAEGAA